MPKLNSTVKSVRVDNEKLAELERRLGDKSINAWLNEQIEGFLSGSVTREVNPVMEDIETMVGLSGMVLDDFWKEICGLMEDGNIEISSVGVQLVSEPWVEDFKEACHDRGLPVEKVAESAIKAVKRGVL